MNLKLHNTIYGLIPVYDEDYDEKLKLKLGETYTAKIKLTRNLAFHRKYFAMLRCAWDLQSEAVQNHFRNNFTQFRKTVQIAAGISEPVYVISRKEFVEQAKSISFESMSEEEFIDLYKSVKNVLFDVFLKNVSESDFMHMLTNY